MWDFKWNKFEVSGIYVLYLYRFLTDSTTAAAFHIGVGQRCAVQTTCCERIPCCQERISKKHGTQVLAMFVEVLRSIEAPFVPGRKEWRLTKLDKQSYKDLPRSGRPEMLQHDDAFVHEDRHFTTRQLALIVSINKGRVCRIIPDLGYSKMCAEWVPRSPAFGQKTERKAISSKLLARLKLRERPSYPGLL